MLPVQFQATPFHSLCQNSAVTTSMIQDLLRHKANPNLKNNVSTRVLMADRSLSKLMLL